jgi:hypothetical protein
METMMMASKQKIKGSTWEREVAKDLSTKYKENFIRTVGSGAYVGGKNSTRKDNLTDSQIRHHKGDITPPDSFHYMNMECKSYSDFPFHLLLTNNCGKLDEWIKQVEECSDKMDLNIIVFKINRKGKYICVQWFPTIVTDNAVKYKDYYVFAYDQFFIDNAIQFQERCSPTYSMLLTRG